MPEEHKKPNELVKTIDFRPPSRSWLDPHTEFVRGTYNYAANPDHQKYLDLPGEKWQPTDDDWPLPDGWEKTLMKGFRDRLDKYRSLKVFMDICVRCGACADKCHFYIGSGDQKTCRSCGPS